MSDLRYLQVEYDPPPVNGQVPVFGPGGWTPTTAVTSVSNSNGSLTISPTTGAVVASINLAHANAFTVGQSITASGATNVPLTIKGASGQTSPLVELRNNSNTVLGGYRSDGSLLIQNTTSTTIVSDGYYAMSAKMDGSANNVAFIVDRNRSQTNAGQGVGIFLKDSTSYVGMRMWANTFVQNLYDYEFLSQVGKVMTMPYNGGINIYNPVVNTQDISCMKVPAQTIYPGAGANDPGGLFVFEAPTLAATSANTLNDTGTLLIKGAPSAGVNMTLPRAHAALIYTGRAGGIGLGIIAHGSQSANLTEWKNSSNTVLSYVDPAGIFYPSNKVLTPNSTSWTPTATAVGGMTFTITTVNHAVYTRFGDFIHFCLVVTGDLTGVANTTIRLSLPVSGAAGQPVFTCLYADGGLATTGVAIVGSTSTFDIVKPDYTNFTIATGRIFWVCGSYSLV